MVKIRFLIILPIFIATLGLVTIFTSQPVSAASGEHCKTEAAGLLGIPTWYKYLSPEFTDPDGAGPRQAECKVHFPKNEENKEDITLAIGPILLAVTEILLRVGTYLAVAVIVWGGFQYQLSQGDPERTKNARTMILNAVIGLALAIFATAIVNLVGRNIF